LPDFDREIGVGWVAVAVRAGHLQAAVRHVGLPARKAAPFFPKIELVFRVIDPAAHYHVPVVVSPYGYSTYRGN
jgi:5-hydroxyisourate hydrolase